MTEVKEVFILKNKVQALKMLSKHRIKSSDRVGAEDGEWQTERSRYENSYERNL